MKRQGYLKGALIISAGGFVSKLLGAVYRIPLIAILGGTGMGIYQMVYPLYCILLTVSASGIPTGIARLIASGNAEGAEKRAFLLYGGIGLCGSLVMYALSGILSAAQGEPAVALCCKLLSPSVLFVAIISVVRGYFQGKGTFGVYLQGRYNALCRGGGLCRHHKRGGKRGVCRNLISRRQAQDKTALPRGALGKP